jgi:hypothetical protein
MMAATRMVDRVPHSTCEHRLELRPSPLNSTQFRVERYASQDHLGEEIIESLDSIVSRASSVLIGLWVVCKYFMVANNYRNDERDVFAPARSSFPRKEHDLPRGFLSVLGVT